MPEDSSQPSEQATSVPSASPVSEAGLVDSTAANPEEVATNPVSDSPATQAQSPVPSQAVVTGTNPRKLKKPLLISGIALAAAVLVGGGLVFGLYLPNTPENVYSAGLANTGKALDVLIAYSKTQENANYKSAKFDGTLKVTSPGASLDFDTNGAVDTDGNLTASMNFDVMGNKGNANIRSVRVPGNTSPDVYFQVSGIKSYLDSSGLGVLDNLDGQWISIDHTLIDTYESQIKEMTLGGVSPGSAPTYAQVEDAETKVQSVNRQYVFTTNPSTAVLANEKYLGQTKEGGRTLNHYQVGYNKDHLRAYAQAVAAALNDSQLNEWSKQANSGKNLSDVMNFAQLESDIMSAKGDYTFDVWVDTGTRLVSKAAFTDTNPADQGGIFTISQGYTGGNDYPFSITVSVKDQNGNPQQYTINVSQNTQTNKVTAIVDGTSKDAGGTTTLSFSMSATPNKLGVTVTAPAGARSVNDVLNELGLGQLGSGFAGRDTASDVPLVFQQ